MQTRRALLSGGAALASLGMAPGEMATLLLQRQTAPALDLNFVQNTTLDSRITFTRASSATYFDSTNTLQTATTNVPRYDYGPTSTTPLGLLIEEARTNSVLSSAVLATQNVTVTAAPWTLSFYGTGTVTMTGTFSGSLVGGGAFPTRVTQTFTPTAGTLTLTVSGSVVDAQLELGGFATSYIPTAGATATRAADVASMPLGAWFTGATAPGTIGAEYLPGYAGNGVASQYAMSVDDGTSTNRYALRSRGAATSSAISIISSGGVTVASSSLLGDVVGTVSKLALAWSGGAAQNAVGNAGAVQATTSAAPVTTLTTLEIGNLLGGSQLDGWLRSVRSWPRMLPNTELRSVTT